MKSSSSSRIIAAEDLGDAAVWRLQSLPGAGVNRHGRDAAEVMNGARTRTRVPGTEATDDILDRRLREALARGFEDGYAQADAAVRAEFAARERLLAPIVENARQAAAALDERVAQHVLDLAMAIAAQIVRSDLAIAPRHFVELIHEGLGLIAEGVTRIVVHVNPADAGLVRDEVAEHDPRIVVVEDPAITSGGCVFKTAHGEIDATIERRLQAIAHPLGAKQPVLVTAPAAGKTDDADATVSVDV